jgi:hypothetical protein
MRKEEERTSRSTTPIFTNFIRIKYMCMMLYPESKQALQNFVVLFDVLDNSWPSAKSYKQREKEKSPQGSSRVIEGWISAINMPLLGMMT